MLSKKMAVSLTSLIIICAFAFVASPALAANELTLSLKDGDTEVAEDQGDYSAADGIQVVASKTIDIKLASKEALGQVLTGNITVVNTGGTQLAVTNLARVNTKEYTFRVADGLAAGESVTLIIAENVLASVKTGIKDHASASLTVHYVTADPAGLTPHASVARSDETTPLIVEDTVVFTVTLSEEPKGGSAKFTADSITVAKAAVDSVDFIGTEDEPVYADDNTDGSTGPDVKVYKYSVAVKPDFTDNIKFTVKQFEDNYGNKSADPAIKEQEFKIAPSKKIPAVGKAGTEVSIPNDLIIPAGGYLIVAKDDEDGTNSEEKVSESLITWPGDPKESAAAIARRKPALRTYNMIEANLPNLETELIEGVTIDLKSAHAVKITEIMWGTDGGSQNRQWIEIMNTTAAALTTKDYKLVFYAGNEPVPPMTAAVAATATTAAVPAGLPAGVADRVGTLDKNAYWSIAGAGQSGRTSDTRMLGENDIEIVSTSSLVSAQRKMTADGAYAEGTMSGSWMASEPPSLNFVEDAKGLLIGTPGDSPVIADVIPTPETPPAAVEAALFDEIIISEIMVDTANGTLPQWIELTYTGMDKATLDGWEMRIDNALDAEVVGAGSIITVSLSGVTVDVSKHEENMGKGQSVLVVAWEAPRKSANIRSARVINLATQLGKAGRYQLLSYNGFKISLVPPEQTVIESVGDIAGNLNQGWDLLMSEGDARSSLIRYDTLADGTATMGTDVNGWVLASGADDLGTAPISYYGDDEDNATPGQHDRGPLPVELSHFRPARDKATGAVVITWATQSELNNAGFFIKRSQQRDGEFKVINATMIPGAGTTSEKQFYTYTDTTAQPNVVYYYQIEDVSLDGNRQTLTQGIRLKGHIGAAGKLTSTWGELKTSNE